jgi:enoyl-CoA hydratase/3-hydroxyacyl-CoA dehydrogenase
VTIDEVHTVLFVGAGTMGCANSFVAAVSGYDIVLNDAKPENLDAVEAQHDVVADFLLQSGYCTADDIAAARGRVSLVADLGAAAAAADLVSESVFEDLGVKRDVHRQLDELCPSGTILTTNSSALLVSDIEDVVRRGDRFAALHSHLGSLLFDIVGGPRTTPSTIDVVRRYVLSLGGTPLVLKKEHPGYLFNAMNGPLLAMAMRLVLDGHATTEAVDRAWMSERGAPMGPFGMIDLFGLELILHSWQRPSDNPSREELRPRVFAMLSDHVDNGRLGLKSGSGFYDYPTPAFQDPGFLSAEPVAAVAADALVSAVICAAVSLTAIDVAGSDVVDLAWTAATGLDIGPFGLLDRLGADAFLETLDAQVASGLIPGDVAELTKERIRADSGGDPV